VKSPDEFGNSSAPSPDGRYVASGVDINGAHDRYRIAIFDAHTAKQVRYVTHGHADTDPVWSPNGRWLAFQRDEDVDHDRQTASICIVRVSGGHVTCPLRDGHEVGTPTWGK
jgi:Tol biopolymer transport system component